MDAGEAAARLKAGEAELRRLGVARLSLFGSTARGEQRGGSDVDVAIELRRDRPIGVFAFLSLERRVAALLDRPVDLVAEPHDEAPRLQAAIDRDRLRVF